MINITNRLGFKYSIESLGHHTISVKFENEEIIIQTSLEDFMKRYKRWQQGDYLQTVFNNLSADEREFLLTRITKQKWDETFKENEE